MNQGNSNFKIENNILKGKEVTYDIGYTSLGKFILDTLEGSPQFVGQIDAITGEEYTYEKMRERSVRCALWMQSQGLLPGDIITVCAHNQLDIAMPCFAALYVGAIFNPLDVSMNPREIVHFMNIMKPKMVFVSEESATTVAEAAKQAKLDLKIIVFGWVAGFLEFERVIGEPEVDEVKRFASVSIRDPNQIALAMCSSGTTGLPKGVALSHNAMLKQLYQSGKFSVSGNKCLIFSSLYWISGILSMFVNLYSKVTKIVTPPFEEHLACELIEKYEVTWIFVSSSIINRLLKSGVLPKCNFSRLKHIGCGGAPLSNASREAFARFVPNARIISGYGITELCGPISSQTANSKPESSGQIVENAQLKVVDPSTGRILGTNEKGELFIKSTSMMSFYYGDPRATAGAIDSEGWLRSGDLGYYDENGEIFIIDRLKLLIKYRGHQISPIEIECVIASHPGVSEVIVVGVPHPEDDEHPLAFVVRTTDSTATGMQVTEKEIVDLVGAELSDSKRLRGGVRFIDHIPKSPSDKARRQELRDLAISGERA